MRVPADFGGFLGYWRDGKAYLIRYGEGQPVEGVQMTPLNVLQAHKTLGALIEQGEAEGHIADEHLPQSAELPVGRGLEDIAERDRVDAVTGGEETGVQRRSDGTVILTALGLMFTASERGLIVARVRDGKRAMLAAEEIDALIRCAGAAWEAMGLE